MQDKNSITSKRELLANKAGVYSFVNLINGKQYIGSAKDFYLRVNEHLSNRKSNRALQSAILKHGWPLPIISIFVFMNTSLTIVNLLVIKR